MILFKYFNFAFKLINIFSQLKALKLYLKVNYYQIVFPDQEINLLYQQVIYILYMQLENKKQKKKQMVKMFIYKTREKL